MQIKLIRAVFLITAIYDFVLGVVFLVDPYVLFEMNDVPPPNHAGYVQFPAFLLITFAIMFLQIARDPIRNRGLIFYGAGLKLAYCLTVFGHALFGEIPAVWLPWAWADLVFLGLFFWSWRVLARPASE